MEPTVIVAVISVASAISGIILGWKGHANEAKSQSERHTTHDTKLRTDMDYLIRGVDDIRLEQKSQDRKLDDICDRVTRVEESAKSAHKRIDRIEKTESVI